MRAFEATALEPENVYGWMNHGLLALVHRNMIAAERSFHKALTTLRGLQKDRGFVSSKHRIGKASRCAVRWVRS